MIFLSFYTTTHSMKGEALAKKQGLAVTIIPTPKGAAGSCSLSLRFDGDDPESSGRAFFDDMIVPCTLFRLDGDNLTRLGHKGGAL